MRLSELQDKPITLGELNNKVKTGDETLRRTAVALRDLTAQRQEWLREKDEAVARAKRAEGLLASLATILRHDDPAQGAAETRAYAMRMRTLTERIREICDGLRGTEHEAVANSILESFDAQPVPPCVTR